MNMDKAYKIAIIGLGYVGLPLAIEFAKKYKVLGFDIDEARIQELSAGEDRTREADLEALKTVLHIDDRPTGLHFSAATADLQQCQIYIVTVPTPINRFKAPDLQPLLKASAMIGSVLKKETS